jgi:hypothetical protein
MISIIKALTQSLRLYLELRNRLAFFEIKNNHRRIKNELINEIEELRAAGDSNSSDRADLLRKRLKSENDDFEHISTVFIKAQGGDSSSDSGGDIHSSD